MFCQFFNAKNTGNIFIILIILDVRLIGQPLQQQALVPRPQIQPLFQARPRYKNKTTKNEHRVFTASIFFRHDVLFKINYVVGVSKEYSRGVFVYLGRMQPSSPPPPNMQQMDLQKEFFGHFAKLYIR